MSVNNLSVSPYLLFLAHGDDEIGFIPIIKINPPKIVIYVTDGSGISAKNIGPTRAKEVEKVWRLLSPTTKVEHFGLQHGLHDGQLHSLFSAGHLLEIVKIITNFKSTAIVTTEPEGGHQDHDFTFIVSTVIANELKRDVYTFPLYRSNKLIGRMYRVMRFGGKATFSQKISISNKFRNAWILFRVISMYRSQRTTWLGLGIPACLSMFRNLEIRKNQNFNLSDYSEAKAFFYEKRKRATRIEVINGWLRLIN
jgi:LmbE family N-acetylglucosaminyl deacetylase